MQLASAHSRQARPDLANVPCNSFRLIRPAVNRSVALVIGLTTDSHELASPTDSQLFDLYLREDLPGRFFVIDTP